MPVPPDLPQVVVEIAPPESAPELKGVLLDACTRAAQGALCVEAGTAREDAPGVVAIVSWRDSGNVRLQVALRREQEWVAREIKFDEHDVPRERWRAVGLVIGTLGSVIARGEAPRPEPPPDGAKPATAAPSQPKPVVPVPERQTPPPPRAPHRSAAERAGSPPFRAWIDAAAIAGSAFLESATPRLGAELGGRGLLFGGLFASAHVGYSESARRTHGVGATFADASVGIGGVREFGRHFTIAAEVDGFCERFASSVSGRGATTPASGERWLGGARLVTDGTWWALEPVGFFVGSGFGWRAGTTEVDVDGAKAGTVPAFGYFFRAGAAIRFR